MSQRTRPDADVSVDAWSPTPVYVHIDEPEPDDDDYVSCAVPPSASFLVHLTNVGAPIAGQIEYEAQPHRLVVRLAGSACTQATVALLNTIGGVDVWIKSQSFDLTADFRDCELVLSYPEVARIEDYEALKVLVVATGDGSCSSSSEASSHSSGSDSGSWSGSGSDSGSWSGGSASASGSNSGSPSGGSASYSASGSGSGTSSNSSSGGSGSASHSSAGSGGSQSGTWPSSSDSSGATGSSGSDVSSISSSESDSSGSGSTWWVWCGGTQQILPPVLYMTLTASGPCAPHDGQTHAFIFDGSQYWNGTIPGFSIQRLSVVDPGDSTNPFTLYVELVGCESINALNFPTNCAPLQVSGEGVFLKYRISTSP